MTGQPQGLLALGAGLRCHVAFRHQARLLCAQPSTLDLTMVGRNLLMVLILRHLGLPGTRFGETANELKNLQSGPGSV